MENRSISVEDYEELKSQHKAGSRSKCEKLVFGSGRMNEWTPRGAVLLSISSKRRSGKDGLSLDYHGAKMAQIISGLVNA